MLSADLTITWILELESERVFHLGRHSSLVSNLGNYLETLWRTLGVQDSLENTVEETISIR